MVLLQIIECLVGLREDPARRLSQDRTNGFLIPLITIQGKHKAGIWIAAALEPLLYRPTLLVVAAIVLGENNETVGKI
jgi:hypothetical protein